jgi:glutathione S-transferase
VLELDDGTFLRESTAICAYLAEGTPLFPHDKLTRARILEWMGFEQTHVDGVISRARFRRMFPNVIPTRAEEFDAWLTEGHAALGVLDAHLERREFLVGDGFTLADIALYACTHVAADGGFDLARFAAAARRAQEAVIGREDQDAAHVRNPRFARQSREEVSFVGEPSVANADGLTLHLPFSLVERSATDGRRTLTLVGSGVCRRRLVRLRTAPCWS